MFKKKEVVKDKPRKYSKVKFIVRYKYGEGRWTLYTTEDIKPPATEEKFDKLEFMKKVKKEILAGRRTLVGAGTHIKNYSFKKVEWFIIHTDDIELVEK